MRINKFIGETGYCSRREADRMVAAGRVTVNGVVAELGSQAEAGDDVRIDGMPVAQKQRAVYIALNKPVGITSTTEPDVAGNIVEYVGPKERIFPIGRLDKDSQGLILLTNDGDIVNRILRAEGRHDKEYVVTVDMPLKPHALHALRTGIHILGSITLPAEVEQLGDKVFSIILHEGRNRQIRRMCKALGYAVQKLERVRIMNIALGDLPYGKWRDLTEAEVTELLSLLD
jgi:23S rRNA pseudouridine2604 synthase